ncbi:MAG: hypothetical protein N2578_01490 [Bdellovibrionaceae bacterium]|nr:hypothetical protein [Pseudobdellovibrionaceae bacterium]
MSEVLVVVSKVKKIIREKGGLNTSQGAIDQLSKAVERLALKAIDSAKADNRKTVLERDVQIDHL